MEPAVYGYHTTKTDKSHPHGKWTGDVHMRIVATVAFQ